jgi:hypothetical protein
LWGLLFVALLGGSAYDAFASGDSLVGALLSGVALLVLLGALRRPPKNGTSLRANVLWTSLGFLAVGGTLLFIGVVDDEPIRALLWIAGPIFMGLGLFGLYMLWRNRHLKEISNTDGAATSD